MDSCVKTMMEVIGNAGFVVSIAPASEGRVSIRATDEKGELWEVTADSGLEAVAELARMLGFEDLN
jgi:hypothetical protein